MLVFTTWCVLMYDVILAVVHGVGTARIAWETAGGTGEILIGEGRWDISVDCTTELVIQSLKIKEKKARCVCWKCCWCIIYQVVNCISDRKEYIQVRCTCLFVFLLNYAESFFLGVATHTLLHRPRLYFNIFSMNSLFTLLTNRSHTGICINYSASKNYCTFYVIFCIQ